MPTIYDNIETGLLDGLREALKDSFRADACVGYFNLRGWAGIADAIDALPHEPACRLIVGMTTTDANTNKSIQRYYGDVPEKETTNQTVSSRKNKFAESLARQLTLGNPTKKDEAALRKLAEQLRGGRLVAKFFGSHRLHAKLYLTYREHGITPITGFVGSSNLTLAGLQKQGELNVDVSDKDAAEKLARWFEDRWQENWCLDISEELADIIENSWAGGPVTPYEIYIKTAYELSKEAIEGSSEFRVPREFQKIMPEFQQKAVSLAAERLNHPNGGVIIGDVVGLGKTLVASAVAKTFQQDQGSSVLVICPPNLEKMWKTYLHDYQIAGDTLSLGATRKLKDMRCYRLVIIDESHNLRNRDSARHAHIRDYIRENDSRAVLLSATPYNKSFTDIGNQLQLFIDSDTDLGVRPDEHIREVGGSHEFSMKHPNTLLSSLAAFEHSESIEDWRELMRMFMVRRTRSHIKKNYAEYDEERKQHYLTFSGGKRFYFPDRVARCVGFELDDQDKQDQYAALYADGVVDIIKALNLPRYGLGQYLRKEYSGEKPTAELNDEERLIVKNLGRARKRLLGFAKSGLFKRLESSGPAFLLSVRRHIVRNAVYLSAIKQGNDKLPIGDVFADLIDENMEEDEQELFQGPESDSLEHFLQAGAQAYDSLRESGLKKNFQWITVKAFKKSLAQDLLQDCENLLKILRIIPSWDAGTDRKLKALLKLCGKTHATEKILIFTQFKDTADYLCREFEKHGIDRTAMVYGGMSQDVSRYVERFSPRSNDKEPGQIDELHILITTDTLSEGQNLQDAHIVVNFDLPWAIIRLVQRAGRVDRIGQTAKEIFCYCFLPEEGIEKIIKLRSRLLDCLEENAELVGSDERFFEGDPINLKQVYDGTLSLEEEEDETDLISRCYDIWRQATKKDAKLKKRIESLPDVVYSAKQSPEGGALVYIKTSHKQHVLAQVNEQGEVVSQSQSRILGFLACEPQEPQAAPMDEHFDMVREAVKHVQSDASHISGVLGGARSIRRRVYDRIRLYLDQRKDTLFESEDLKQAGNMIYHWPLKETTRDRFRRQLRTGVSDEVFIATVRSLWEADDFCAVPSENEPIEPHIICSMSLSKQ